MNTPTDRFLTGSATGSFSTRPTTGSPVPSPTGTGTGGSGSFGRRNQRDHSTSSSTQPLKIDREEPPIMSSTQQDASDQLVALSEWIDEGNAHRDTEAVTWGRLAKIQEEAGEVIEAFIGYTGQNPRKGITHDMGHVRKELLDVAVTALGAIEHIDGHGGAALTDLEFHIRDLARRAGLTA